MKTMPVTALLAIGALMSASPAQAAKCWDKSAFEAAQQRELHVMLMTVQLRCRNINPDITANYEKFEVNHKKSIFAAEASLRAHYGGTKDTQGKEEFAKFHSGIANFYGTGRTDATSCAMFNVVTSELAKSASNAQTLSGMAADMVPRPRIDGPRCGETVTGQR